VLGIIRLWCPEGVAEEYRSGVIQFAF
jgi:hypothetical protein